MLTVAGVFSTSLNNYDVERILIDWFTYLLITVSGFIFVLVLQIFALEKIKSAMHIVFIVFYIIAVLFVCAISGKTDAPYALIPFLTIEYFIQAGINDMFILHDRFIYECETFEGKELETYLFHNNLTAIDLTEKTKNQQVILFGLSVAMFMILVFGKLSEGLFNPLITALVILFYLSVLLCSFTVGLFRNDVFYAFLGFKDFINNKRRLFTSVFLIFLLSAGAAFVISSDKPLIKIHYVEEYKEAQQLKYQQNITDFLPGPVIENPVSELDFSNEKPNWIIEFIFEFIKYAAIAGLAFALIYFFIRPFFTNHWREFWSEGRLLKFLHNIWDDLLVFFKMVFSKDKSQAEAYSSVESRKFRDSMMDFLNKAKRSKEKNAEIDRLTKQFMRLIDWGESHKIHYRANLAPAEYTELIANFLQTEENKNLANKAGLLFEKALYDKELLSKDEEKDFLESINKVMQCV